MTDLREAVERIVDSRLRGAITDEEMTSQVLLALERHRRSQFESDPTCDVCGRPESQVLSVGDEWCGSCGCCRSHCQQFVDCPDPDGEVR